MKPKNINLLVTIAVSLCLLIGSIAVINFILKSRKPTKNPASAKTAADKAARTTRIEVSTVPAKLEAGKSTIWSLKIVDAKKLDRHGKMPKYIRSYTPNHGNMADVVIASEDLSYFHRPRLDYKDYGHFMFDATLPRAGKYRLYADYMPYQQQREAAQHEIVVPGQQTAPQKLVDDVPTGGYVGLISKDAMARDNAGNETGPEYTVSLMLPATGPKNSAMPSFVAGKEFFLMFRVNTDQTDVGAELEPYFGSRGRCDIFSSNGQIHWSLHSIKTESSGADPTFKVRFPSHGFYKLWLQFRHKGKVIQAPFTLNVLQK